MTHPILNLLNLFCAAIVLPSLIFAPSVEAQWQVGSVDSAGNSGWTLSIDVAAQGDVAASYFTTDPNGYQRHSVLTGAGWTEDREIEFGDDFRFDNNGVPHFMFTPSSSGFAPALTTDMRSGAPTYTPVDLQRGTSGQILGFDAQNYPHVAYINTNSRTLKYAAWNGSDWDRQDVHTADSFRFGNSYFIGGLDGNDNPHFFFPNGEGLSGSPIGYAAPNGNGWTVNDVVNEGRLSSMAIDSSGNPHISFEQSFSNSLRYGIFDGTAWAITPVTGLEGSFNFDSELVLDANDDPHLFVHESEFLGSEYVTHTYLDGSTWTKDRIASWDDSSDGPEGISAVMDGNRLHVLYSTGNQEILYATRTVAAPLLGDVDLNGAVEFLDVFPFIDVLTAGRYQIEADCDESGSVNFSDISPFITILGSQ